MKKWRSIESRNRFYCDGRCVTGHDIGVFIFALSLITVISGLFFIVDCPYLTKRLSPAIPAFAGLLYLSVLCCIFRTACSDPGILPRATFDEVRFLERTILKQFPSNLPLSDRTIEIQMNSGHRIQLKFCSTCKIFRPPRVSHCSLCDACIANFDHHCPWVGNCVGLRNYRYFYLFLFSLSLLCLYILSFNITNIVLRSQDKPSFVDAIRDTPMTIVETFICFFSVWSILGLWGYHTYLICRSVTTNEDIKDTWSSSSEHETMKNPFSRANSCSNCFSTLCGPLPPSFLNLRTTISTTSHQTDRFLRQLNNHEDYFNHGVHSSGFSSIFDQFEQQRRSSTLNYV